MLILYYSLSTPPSPADVLLPKYGPSITLSLLYVTHLAQSGMLLHTWLRQYLSKHG